MFLWVETSIIKIHISKEFKSLGEFDTHNIIEEKYFIILVQSFIMIFIPGLVIKISCTGWLSMVNTTRVFTPRLPRIYVLLLPMSNVTSRGLFTLISSNLVLMWLISISNSVVLVLMTSFVSGSPHLLQISFQLSNMLSLFLHHRNNFFIWDGTLGNSFHFGC